MLSQNIKKIVISFFITAILLLLVLFSIQKIHCYDAWGHVALGRYIVENKCLPFYDIFSYTAEGAFFYNFSWLYQTIFYFLYLLANLPALFVVKTLTLLLTFYLLFLVGYRKIPIFFLLFGLLISILNARVRFFLRPEIFTFLFLSFYLFSLSKYLDESKKWIYFLPLIQLFWVNMHSISMLGFVILFVYVIGEYIIKKVSLPFDWNNQGFLNIKQIKILFYTTGICIMVSFINPYGYKIFHHYLKLFSFLKSNSDILPCGIQELQPIFLSTTSFFSMEMVYFKLLILLCFSLIIINIKRQHISTLLIFLGFLYLAKASRRNVGIFSIIACFIFFENIKIIFKKNKIIKLKNKWFCICNIIVIVLMIFIFYNSFKEIKNLDAYIDGKVIKRVGIGDNPLYPEGAFNFIEKNKIKGNMFNAFNFGHYLIWKGYPGRQVFVDGRTGVYEDYILRLYANSFLFKESVEYVIDKYDINFFFLRAHSGRRFLNKFLYESKDWELVYFSPFATIYIKNISENKDIIEKANVKFDSWKKKINKLKKINENYYQKVNPEFISLVNEGMFFKNIGKLNYAKLAFKESIKLNPNLLNIYLQLANIYITEDNYKNMVIVLENAIEKGLVSKKLYTNLGYGYENLGKLNKAISLYKKAISKWGEKPSGKAYFNLARIYYQKGMYRKAIGYINQAIKFEPNNYINYYTKGTIYIAMDLYNRAIKPLEKTVELNPVFAEGYNNLAVCYYHLGFKEKSSRIFQKALELNPSLEKTTVE